MSVTTTQGYKFRLVAGNTLSSEVILDTFANEDIKISNNITDLFDIAAVPGTFTRTITLPGTKTNNDFFEHYYDISVYEPDLFNTNQRVFCYLDFGSVFLVNGYLNLVKVNVLENKFVDSYEVNIFGAISNFSVDATRFFLNDLSNLSSYNHTSSAANITSSWNLNLFSGDVVYPMADYGQRIQYSTQEGVGIDDPEDAMVVQDYKPAMKLKVIFDAIFDKCGFTYTGSFMEQAFIDDIYVFLNANKRYPLYNEFDLETFGQAKVTNETGSNQTVLSALVESDLAFNTINYDFNNLVTIGTPTLYNQQVESKLQCDLTLSFRVTGSGAGSGMPAFTLYYYNSGGSLIASQSLSNLNNFLDTVRANRSTTTNEIYVLTERINTPTLPIGDFKIKIEYAVQGVNNFTVTLNPEDARQTTSLEILQVRQAGDGLVFDVPLNMPFGKRGIRLIDFIRAIQKKFNLVIYEDRTTPDQFIVETFNDWYLDGTVRNFNEYINLNDKIEIVPANNLAYNILSFSDIQDSDYVSTVFKQVNNRTFGQSFFQDTGSFFSQGEFDVQTVVGSGPLAQIGFTGFSGSSATGTKCNTYNVINYDPDNYLFVEWNDCFTGILTSQTLNNQYENVYFCSSTYPVTSNTNLYQIINEGDCSPQPDVQSSGSFLPVSIPIFIGDENYAPTRVQPRLMFFNGMISSSEYYIEYIPSTSTAATASSFTVYPYFDNYNVITGSFPTSGSRSLLFNNEESSRFGAIPQESLITSFWSKYIDLLYNPRTRLVNASAVIPLADYFEIELNDLAQFRGNYYHIRAINDYNLTTGECLVQLLGPVIEDSVAAQLFNVLPTPIVPPGPAPVAGDFNDDFNNDFS